jgi:hypothetical protein
MSLSGSSGNLTVKGSITNTSSITSIGPIWINSTSVDGGNLYGGIGLWGTDRNWGIYISTNGANKSFNNGIAVNYGVSSHAIRFRVNGNDLNGYIWENNSEEGLMSLTGASGNLKVKGSITSENVIYANRGNNVNLQVPATNGVGERLILYNTSNGATNLAMGVQLGAMWFNVGSADAYLFYAAGSPIFYISSGGAVQAKSTITASVATPSDYRIKKNIISIEDKFIDKINNIRCVEFEYKKVENSIFNGEHLKNTYGFIAHELQEVFPNCVSGEKDQIDNEGKEIYQSINLFPIITILTKGIQELINENDLLKVEIENLKTKNKILESKIDYLYTYLNINK